MAERKEGLQLYLKQLMGVPLVWQFEELLHFLDDERHTLAVQWDLLVRVYTCTCGHAASIDSLLLLLFLLYHQYQTHCSDGSDSLRC